MRLSSGAPSTVLAQTIAIITFFTLTHPCSAAITVYYQNGQTPLSAVASATTTATGAAYTGLAAYDPTTLQAPAPPGPSAVPTAFGIQVPNGVPSGASIPQLGSFFGFSIEMSVVNQVLGKNASVLAVPFLNLMANLQQRVGQVRIRVGGNTQETATLVETTPDGKILEKDLTGITNPTQTPPLIFTPELLYMLANISSLVDVRWHLGIPFNDTSNFRLAIAEQGEAILGDYLIGLQAGNEPDLYVAHLHRNTSYSFPNYFVEFGMLIQAMAADSGITRQDLLLGPSISNIWTPEDVWNTGFVDAYNSNLAWLSVEKYPTDNCAAKFPGNNFTLVNPQDAFPTFLTHQSGLNIVAPYLNSTAFATSKGKKLLMFETNTASCGGFPGVSDAFGAALWGVDYALQMAAVSFSGALFHVGGQSVSYNPFTPPPTNQSTFNQWTIGPIYYSALVVAEALGPTNTSQVMDLQSNNNNMLTPAYGIWENGNLARLVLINFVSDSTGASDISVDVTMSDSTMPGTVQVKYLQAESVSQKGNFTWAGQTFGANFESDGRPVGTETIETITCSPNSNGTNTCTVKVPAPGIALVILSSSDITGTAAAPTQTFATTAVTKLHNTATLDPSVLATSNGHMGFDQDIGSTSVGSVEGGAGRTVRSVGVGGLAVVMITTVAVMMCLGR